MPSGELGDGVMAPSAASPVDLEAPSLTTSADVRFGARSDLDPPRVQSTSRPDGSAASTFTSSCAPRPSSSARSSCCSGWSAQCSGSYFEPYNPTSGEPLPVQLAPSAAHWFGTDSSGRDVLSRVIVGARDILIVAPLATLLGTVLGTAIGLVQGYFRGVVDNVVGRMVDAVLALPW